MNDNVQSSCLFSKQPRLFVDFLSTIVSKAPNSFWIPIVFILFAHESRAMFIVHCSFEGKSFFAFTVFVDLGTFPTDTATLSFTFGSATATTRVWEIKIYQIECSNPSRYNHSVNNRSELTSYTYFHVLQTPKWVPSVPHYPNREAHNLQLLFNNIIKARQPTVVQHKILCIFMYH